MLLRRLHRCLTAAVTIKTIATSLVSSKLDYCNSILYNIPNQKRNKLQSVQYCLARVVTRSPRFCSVIPLLKSPHWRPGGGGAEVVVSTAAFHARVRGSLPGLGLLKETKMFLPHPLLKLSIVGNLRDRGVACSASDLQGSSFESCVLRAVSAHSSPHPQEALLAQFSLYVHKSGLKPDSFHFLHWLPVQFRKKYAPSNIK